MWQITKSKQKKDFLRKINLNRLMDFRRKDVFALFIIVSNNFIFYFSETFLICLLNTEHISLVKTRDISCHWMHAYVFNSINCFVPLIVSSVIKWLLFYRRWKIYWKFLSNGCHSNPINSKGFIYYYEDSFRLFSTFHISSTSLEIHQPIFILFNIQFHASRNFSETIMFFSTPKMVKWRFICRTNFCTIKLIANKKFRSENMGCFSTGFENRRQFEPMEYIITYFHYLKYIKNHIRDIHQLDEIQSPDVTI